MFLQNICNKSLTERLSSHSLILTFKINNIRGPPELSKHDWKEHLPDFYTKIALCMQPKRFINHSVLALCTDISALMNKGL